MQIDTLRPDALVSQSGWSASPSGTLFGVTSDNSDSTFALCAVTGVGSPMVLGLAEHALPSGHQRHLVRARVRLQNANVQWSVGVPQGGQIAGGTGSAGSAATLTGSWGTGVPPTGASQLTIRTVAQLGASRVLELYVDVDSRLAPTFTLQVLDDGTPTTTVTTTNAPQARANAVSLDGLPSRQYRYWVTDAADAIVWDTGIVSGPAATRSIDPLENGSYRLHAIVWSTLGADTAYASDEELVDFTVSTTVAQQPESVEIVDVQATPYFDITTCAPDDMSEWDGDEAFVEIQRIDCNGTQRIALAGPVSADECVTYRDWSAHRSRPGDPCVVDDTECVVDLYSWGGTVLDIPAVTGSYAMTLDTSSIDVTGSIDVRAHIAPDDWTPSLVQCIASKFTTTGNQRSWRFNLTTTGLLRFSYSTSGASGTLATHDSTAAVSYIDGSPHWVRVTRSSTAGTIVFYTSEDGVAWTQLGASVAGAAGNMFNSTAPLLVGNSDAGSADRFIGLVYEVQVINGLTGSTIAHPRFDLRPIGSANFEDEQGNEWSLEGSATIVGDLQGWVGEGSTSVQWVAQPAYLSIGALQATETMGAGFAELRFNDASGLRDLSADGTLLRARVLVPESANGTDWQARLEVQDPSFTWVPGPNYSVTPGVWTEIEYEVDPALIADMRSIGFAIGANDVNDTQSVYVDAVQQVMSCPVSRECSTTWRIRFLGTIDGLITASDWFGEPISAIVPGIIIGWPSTEETVPFGWARKAELDSAYPKGITTSVTEPGTLAGSSTHTHTTPGHSHTTDHSHTSTGASGAGNGSFSGNDGVTTGVDLAYPAAHTHTVPATNSASVSSQSASPGTSAVSNQLDRVDVVWIEATSQTNEVPLGSIMYMDDVAPTGWATYTDATGRFLRGAAPGVGGGGTAAGTLASHTHTVDGHTHSGTTHGHTSANVGNTAGTLSYFAGATSAIWASQHDHPVTVANSTTAALASNTAVSNSQSPSLPPWINTRVQQNAGGSLPVDSIALWTNSLASIPTGWKLCDGTSGTPNMLGRYPQGATSSIGTTGGTASATHTHTGASHTHTTSGHSHTRTSGVSDEGSQNLATGPPNVAGATTAHTHSVPTTDSNSPTVGSSSVGGLDSTTSEPVHRQVAFIQFTGLPPVTGTGDVVERTLEWEDGVHLIRALTPDGPVFASVCGQLSWTVDRPFTVNQGVMGSRQVFSASPGGHDFRLTLSVRSEAELQAVLEVLDAALVLVSPADSAETWASPVGAQISVVKVGRIREVTVPMVATGPEPQLEVD